MYDSISLRLDLEESLNSSIAVSTEDVEVAPLLAIYPYHFVLGM